MAKSCESSLVLRLLAVTVLLLILHTDPALSISCHQSVYLVSPLFIQGTDQLGTCEQNSTCVYLKATTTKPSLHTPSITEKIPSEVLQTSKAFTYLYHGCVKSEECDGFCESANNTNNGTFTKCEKNCCTTDKCNVPTSDSEYCNASSPCSKFGKCVRLLGSSYCQCQPGFYGMQCQNKYTSKRICAQSSTTTFWKGSVSHVSSEPLRLSFCDGLCGNASYNGRMEVHGLNVTGVSQFCLNQSACNNLTEFGRQQLKKSNITLLSVVFGKCCDGDLCNIGNISDILPTGQPPKTTSKPESSTPSTTAEPRTTASTPSVKYLNCYTRLYSYSPLFKEFEQDSSKRCGEGYSCFFANGTFSERIFTDQVKIPSELENQTSFSYIQQGCIRNEECANYSAVLNKTSNGALRHLSYSCCKDDYCNTGTVENNCKMTKPYRCPNLGSCNPILKSTYCICAPGFYGRQCEKKYTSQRVCATSNKITGISGADDGLQAILCQGTCANASYTAKVDSVNVSVTGFGRFCITNQSFCDNLLEYGRIELKKIGITILSGNGACCKGDLCNFGTAVPTPPPTPTPTTDQGCSSNPCKNAGTCVPIGSGYRCQCSINFTGKHCEQATYCFLQPCLHGGTCTPVGTTSYRCTCQSGYSGKRCEKMDNCTYQNLYDHSGAQMMPDTNKYIYRCFQVNFPDGDIYFYGKKHSSFYICRNGIIKFNSPWSNYWPYKFGAYNWHSRAAIIAPYWAMVDTYHPFRNSSFNYRGYQFPSDPNSMSKVYYQVINKTSSPILDQATNDVRKYSNDSSYSDFKATLVIIVTWENLYPQRYSSYYSSPYYHLANKFQLVLITDGVTLFGMFLYPCRGIQWVVRATGSKWQNYWYRTIGLPVAGWNSGTGITNKFFNLPGSSSLDMLNIDKKKGNVDETGRWFFRLNEGTLSARVAEQKCRNWHRIQLALGSHLPIPSRLPRNFICPCTFSQIQWDRRFRRDWWYQYYYKPKGVTCGITRRCIWQRVQIKNPEKGNLLYVWISVCQRCCYSNERDDFGSLMVGPQYGGSITIRAYWYGLRWYTNDDDAHQLCCVDSNLCDLYYSVRPSDTCNGYLPPRRSFFWGDPHLVTLDNKNYTFNGLGEYIMADVGNGLFQLQARTKKVSGDVATVFSAAAAKETSTSNVEIKLDGKGGLDVIVNGSVVNVTSEQNGNATEIGNLTLSRDENNNVIAAFPSGISVGIGVIKGIMMSITFSAPEDYKNKTKGLLGVWNDNMEDDFTLRNGTIMPVSSSGRTIHKFGLDWQITQEESLFTYRQGESVDTYKNTSYTPLFADELKFFNDSLKKQAEAICGSNVACLFDAAATKDASVGEASLKSSKNFENETKQLENFPPVFINATKSLKMIINQKTIIELNAIDKNNDPTEFVYPSLPGLQATKSANKLTLEWTITSTNKVNFTVVVKDTKGASSTWTPTITLCACQNGNCTDVVDQSGDRFQVMPCQCKSGYTGSLCESDINGCEASGAPCYPGVVCTDLPPPNGVDGFKCGPCPNGFSGNGAQCIDIDECINGTSKCQQNCINTPGSFTCACKAGYTLKSDQRNCEDINECKKPVCQDKCTNTVGSYKCECNEGFKVDPSDSSKCVPTEACAANIGCQHVCYRLKGQDKCSCNKGYKPNQDDGKKCDDIDECSLSPKPCSQKCTNNDGSYVCVCNQGYRLQDDKSTCEDINECIDSNLYNCSDENQVCINTEGAYRCECAEGLEFRDGKCREKPPTPTPGPTTTPTPTPSPRTPTEEEKLQSVLLRVLNMKLSEWTAQVQSNFKKAVAALAKAFCKNNKTTCGLQESQRKRRAAADPEYNEASVHLLPGYPKENGTDLLIAFYVLNPGSGDPAVPVLVIIEIMKNGTAQIKTSLGDKELGEIQRLFAQTTARPTTSAPTSPPSETWKWIVIGVVCGVFLLIIIIVVVLLCIRKAKNEKRARIAVGDPNEAYHDDEQLEMEKVR